MKWSDLTDGLQALLHDKYIEKLRENFDEMESEVIFSFLDLPETQQQYVEYKEQVWRETLREGDTDWSFADFLRDECGVEL